MKLIESAILTSVLLLKKSIVPALNAPTNIKKRNENRKFYCVEKKHI